MKAMICEMCSSNDLIKQNEVYICQCCGTKYSIEEARKLLFDGTVKIDNSNKLDSLYKAARRAKNNKDYRAAREYYEKILHEDPTNWEATLFVKYPETNMSAGSRFALRSLGETIHIVLGLVQDNITDPTQKADAIKVVVSHALSNFDYYVSSMRNYYDCRKTKYSDGAAIDPEILRDRRENFNGDYLYINGFLKDLSDTIQHVSDLDLLTSNALCNEICILINKLDECNKQYRANEANSGNCYIATCVYGSYDCPQVWILRRFRDNTLACTLLGRLFIETYYALSPTIVRWFGKTNWFRKMCKAPLDRLVTKLHISGIEDSPYNDRQ